MKAIFTPLILLSCLALFFFPASLATGLSAGLDLLFSRALPALFPYMIVTAILRRSGAAALLTRPLASLFSRLFGVEANGILPFLVGLFAGYPLGVSTACALCKEGKLSSDSAERLLFFCANPSPAFLIAGVGIGVWKSAAAGILLFSALTLSALLAGIVQNLVLPAKRFILPEKTTDVQQQPQKNILVLSVRESVSSMAIVGGFLLFFSALSELLPFSPSLRPFFSGLLEVTGGVFSLPPTAANLPLAAFLCGLGGVCVYAQSSFFIGEAALSRRRYLFGRLTVALTACAITALFLKITG